MTRAIDKGDLLQALALVRLTAHEAEKHLVLADVAEQRAQRDRKTVTPVSPHLAAAIAAGNGSAAMAQETAAADRSAEVARRHRAMMASQLEALLSQARLIEAMIAG